MVLPPLPPPLPPRMRMRLISLQPRRLLLLLLLSAAAYNEWLAYLVAYARWPSLPSEGGDVRSKKKKKKDIGVLALPVIKKKKNIYIW